MKPLGKTQRGLLWSMTEHRGRWYVNCGWLWDTHSGTARICESLVKRGLLAKTGEGRDAVYSLTAAGRAVAESHRHG